LPVANETTRSLVGTSRRGGLQQSIVATARKQKTAPGRGFFTLDVQTVCLRGGSATLRNRKHGDIEFFLTARDADALADDDVTSRFHTLTTDSNMTRFDRLGRHAARAEEPGAPEPAIDPQAVSLLPPAAFRHSASA
jgi:hypothetical protein